MGDFSRAAKEVSRLRDELSVQHDRATKDSMNTLQNGVKNEIRVNDSIARRVLITDVLPRNAVEYPQFVARTISVPGWARYLEHGTGSKARTDTLPDHNQYKAPDPLPPIDPIHSWVLMKNVTSGLYNDPLRLAHVIQNEIGDMGTYPHPFLRTAWYDGTNGYRNVIRANKQAMRKAVRRSF